MNPMQTRILEIREDMKNLKSELDYLENWNDRHCDHPSRTPPQYEVESGVIVGGPYIHCTICYACLDNHSERG